LVAAAPATNPLIDALRLLLALSGLAIAGFRVEFIVVMHPRRDRLLAGVFIAYRLECIPTNQLLLAPWCQI